MAYPDHILPEDREVYFDSHDLSVIEEPLRSRIYTMQHDCPDPTYVVSGRRSPWQQYLLRVGRCGAAMAFDSDCKGRPTTALPYHSNHQRGTAIDMGGLGLSWMIVHRHEYGLSLPVPGENWHFEVDGPSQVRILPYPGGAPVPATPPTLPPEDLMDEATLFSLLAGAMRPPMRLFKIVGDGIDETWVTDGLSIARRVGPKYFRVLDDHFQVGGVVELPLADAAVIGNIVKTGIELRGASVPPSFRAENPRTWP